jgi:hypothetical protein
MRLFPQEEHVAAEASPASDEVLACGTDDPLFLDPTDRRIAQNYRRISPAG